MQFRARFRSTVPLVAACAVLLAATSLARGDDCRIAASAVWQPMAFASPSTYYGASPARFDHSDLVRYVVGLSDYSQPYANDGTVVRQASLACGRRRVTLLDNSRVYANDGTQTVRSPAAARRPVKVPQPDRDSSDQSGRIASHVILEIATATALWRRPAR